jgi:hypothetical protein
MNVPTDQGCGRVDPGGGGIFSYAVAVFVRRQSVRAAVQLIGAAGLAVVVVAHVCEALHLLPWFGWGQEHSVGHYIDLSSAVLGLTLLPLGYVFRRRRPL